MVKCEAALASRSLLLVTDMPLEVCPAGFRSSAAALPKPLSRMVTHTPASFSRAEKTMESVPSAPMRGNRPWMMAFSINGCTTSVGRVQKGVGAARVPFCIVQIGDGEMRSCIGQPQPAFGNRHAFRGVPGRFSFFRGSSAQAIIANGNAYACIVFKGRKDNGKRAFSTYAWQQAVDDGIFNKRLYHQCGQGAEGRRCRTRSLLHRANR